MREAGGGRFGAKWPQKPRIHKPGHKRYRYVCQKPKAAFNLFDDLVGTRNSDGGRGEAERATNIAGFIDR